MAVLSLALAAGPAQAAPARAPHPAPSTTSAVDAVDQFIGTGYDQAANEGNKRGNDWYGNTFPGATVPFGMVQLSPTTYDSRTGDQWGGYVYGQDRLRGFGMTRLSGTGCRPRYGGNDFPVLPYTGSGAGETGLPTNPATDMTSYYPALDHAGERQKPGSYGVRLKGVDVDLAATQRVGVSRFRFDRGTPATLMFDAAGSNNDLSGARIAYDPATGRLSGQVTSKIVCASGPTYTAYFVAQFDPHQVKGHGSWDTAGVHPGQGAASLGANTKHGAGAYLSFADGADVTVRMGLSYVSTDGAAANLSEVGVGTGAPRRSHPQSLGQVRARGLAAWRRALGGIDAAGGTAAQRTTFYTALYHSLIHPNVFNDVDGRYLGYDDRLHRVAPGHDFYVNFSGWDTYRGQAQLVAVLFPDVASDINQSILGLAQQTGTWSSWPSLNRVQTKMSGDSLQVIVAATDALGARNYDRAATMKSMVDTQELPASRSNRTGAQQFAALGWVDGDTKNAAVTRSIEYTTDDFAISHLAASLGDQKAFDTFSRRSQNWADLINPTTHQLDARNRSGFMNVPLNTQGDYFEQSTGKQYGFNVAHNMAGLIDKRGGRAVAERDLDALLTNLDGGAFSDTAYLANQPSFGLPWVYNWLGAPEKTTRTLHRAADQLFTTGPYGLAGNDDLGSLSAWYVWSNIGLMPGIWGSGDLLVSAPFFDRVRIASISGRGVADAVDRGRRAHHASPRRTFTITAPGVSAGRPYATGLRVDGLPRTASWLPETFARTGGRLDFTVSARPGHWGHATRDLPPSYRAGENARNGHGVTTDGSAGMGALDVAGRTLSSQDLARAGVASGGRVDLPGTGIGFAWPCTADGTADHWIPHGQQIPVPRRHASSVSFLGLSTNGPATGTARVEYTDGSHQDVSLTLTDWTAGSPAEGNITAVQLNRRNLIDGTSDTAAPALYATRPVSLDPHRTVAAVRLPQGSDRGIQHIFSIGFAPAGR